ncbi:ABC transporter substrate-binding protein [Pseudarthrobacter sp. NamE2]|uniref:ABC transporter substrate-binding protein n=1 Tax=Pseudarthrobacter sp. NamE2 TaxID=2576838 RepID=UPI0010FEF642|nr:ABC transporter substrate-binding protein [Pseudarthrobacter sp. NamE2]TLM83560.1 ABC transporter substrate-binding protein [Pseudarthrobacter sp. NamE2]
MITVLSRARSLTRAASATVAVAALLATAACSSASPDTSAQQSQSRDQELSIAVQAPPASLDPSQLAEGQQSYVWASIFDTLLLVDKEGKVRPNAAESWKYSEDLRTLTLKLRGDLKFSAGDAVTAKDVVGTLERTRATPGQQQSKLAKVTAVSAPDDSTVVIQLSAPEPSLLNYLAQATGVIGDPETLAAETTKLRPAGSGPYVLSDATVDGTEYVLERREDHWNAAAYPFKTVKVKVIQDRTAQYNALQAGEVKAAFIQAPQRQQAEAAGFKVKEVQAVAALALILADRKGELVPALADVKVRQAINMAFDREQVVKALLQGVGRPTVQVFNPNGDAYNSELEGTYDFDPEKARKLLAEAGYADGFSMTMPSTVISQSFEPVITQALADIGIKVTWEPVPPQNTAASISSKKYPAVLWFAGLNEAGREVGDMYTPEAFLNPFKWQDPEFDKLLQKIANESDEEARADLYKKVSEYTVKQALNAPIAYTGTLWATAPDVEFIPSVVVLPTVRDFGVTSG